MPTTITLEGVRSYPFMRFWRGRLGGLGRDDRNQWLGCPPMGCGPKRLGDAWSDDAAGGNGNAVADFTTAAVGWGVLAFALGTAALRGYGAVQRRLR